MKLKGITGIDKIISRAKRVRGDLGSRFAIGAALAGSFLQRESQELVPVDMGDLKNSAFTHSTGTGFKTDVVVGYTKDYAAYVHENLDAAHGAEFNEKYADKIANRKKRMAKRRKAGKTGIHDTYHSRGEGQMAKFLEIPARMKRKEILSIIRTSVGQ
jgi:hypothetical protein